MSEEREHEQIPSEKGEKASHVTHSVREDEGARVRGDIDYDAEDIEEANRIGAALRRQHAS